MNAGKLLVAAVLGFVLSTGLAQAKIPVAPMDDAARAQAEAKKVKDAEAAKKAAEALAKAQDRVVERYRKTQVKNGKPAPAAKSAGPAVAPTRK